MSESINYPLISVVIPSFNQGQYIEETILSVLGQQYPKLEVLILDGGSTDNTIDILKKYSSQISYWHSKKDNGQADAINQGINMSSGDVVCWLNSDDMYLPGTLLDIGKRFSDKINKNHLIYGASITINQDDNNLISRPQKAAPFDAFSLTYRDFIVQPSSFWTRKLWKSTGELKTSYNYVLDWEWFIRASKITDFEYVTRFYSVYRHHSLHKTSNGGSERRKEIIDVVQQYSSDYWIDVYIEIEKNYEQIKNKLALINSLPIPQKKFWLPILFPKLRSKLKKFSHLFTVLNMYS
jgi:glycosyltransferase involved in cell wall biosynthesis